mmetsp:Transcript_20968/g.53304  ORF Transcript_20968/g.53304 Transcript_20968/m.53304 type:complete len:232 (-) Transcript_20968:148-843(-)|eukprot:CAMPEP_0202869502 /NCGR_PEP_ID=MMETSP1391-20130828/12489_1 /ASSEMBLY_ACC=CAM_ASM_000867 /TAXON_ID=1034604 /ORGANISM="Chlamydomonas leiostraca, Strain SAG 11-49" /LENGTH=231 /DNA_ID=CAMNT_0049549827 /DNA_START=165 /DNA_END=860 /DNA_ORIENTATION=-
MQVLPTNTRGKKNAQAADWGVGRTKEREGSQYHARGFGEAPASWSDTDGGEDSQGSDTDYVGQHGIGMAEVSSTWNMIAACLPGSRTRKTKTALRPPMEVYSNIMNAVVLLLMLTSMYLTVKYKKELVQSSSQLKVMRFAVRDLEIEISELGEKNSQTAHRAQQFEAEVEKKGWCSGEVKAWEGRIKEEESLVSNLTAKLKEARDKASSITVEINVIKEHINMRRKGLWAA